MLGLRKITAITLAALASGAGLLLTATPASAAQTDSGHAIAGSAPADTHWSVAPTDTHW